MASTDAPEFQLKSNSRSGSYKTRKRRWRRLRKFLLIFHPAVFGTGLLFAILAWKANRILNTPITNTPRLTGMTKLLSERTLLREGNIPPTEEMMDEAEFENIKKYGLKDVPVRKKRFTPSKFPTFKSERPVPRTTLDDVLLDAEMPVLYKQCLRQSVVKALDAADNKSRELKPHLSEHLEPCDVNEDCLQISPFKWAMAHVNTNIPCRKRTFLRCNITSHECICHDKYDIKYDVEVRQYIYQWNPLTKTCYVRGTNPCKMEIPCAPGTTCRATASISYNTPPIQRVCECTDIGLTVNGGNPEWWYCKQYWQRTWQFDMDNIKQWRHPPYHLFTRILKVQTFNSSNETAQGKKTDSELEELDGILGITRNGTNTSNVDPGHRPGPSPTHSHGPSASHGLSSTHGPSPSPSSTSSPTPNA